MDVSTIGYAGAAAASQAASAPAVTTTGEQSAAPVQSATTAVPSPVESSTSSAPSATSNSPQHNNSAIAPAIAKLFGSAVPPEPIRLDVSYRVLHDPNVIVTVFSDPKTGEEVAQFPPELLIQMAQFFDQHQGATLDRNA
jgi:uncharacterized FlaG/YvyC family protein